MPPRILDVLPSDGRYADGRSTVQLQVSLTSTILLLLALVRFSWTYSKARVQFPGPPIKNLWVGNLDQTLANDVHVKWIDWNRQYGHIYQTWNGLFSRIIYIGNPDIIAKITMANWPRATAQYAGFKPLQQGSLSSIPTNEKWRVQRRKLEPVFQQNVVRAQHDTFSKHLETLASLLDLAVETERTLDFAELSMLLTLEILGDIAFGNEINALTEGSSCRVLQLCDQILPELMKCGLFPLRAKYPVLKSTRTMLRAVDELRVMVEGAIARVRENEKTSDKSGKVFEIIAQQRESDGSYTFEPVELRDNYLNFLIAGAEPTANALSFIVYEILLWPEVLQKLRAELDSKATSGTFIPEFDEIKDLPYLNMVIKEGLRLHPSGFGTFRTCPVDTEVAGVKLPANTTLAIWNPAVHRDPRLWDTPDSFRPERWKDGLPAKRGSYFPFSYGPRKCIGERLAMYELVLTLATLIKHYDLTLEPDFKMEYFASFAMKPKNGLPVRVSKRQT